MKRKKKFYNIAQALILLFGLGSVCWSYFHNQTEIITVKRLEVKRYGDSDKYLIHATSGKTFENTDVFYRLKFRSADLQGSLTEGEEYLVEYYGWRIGPLSWFPNIINAEPTKK